PNLEPAEALGLLLADLDIGDLGSTRAGAQELNELLDRVGRALDHRLNRAVGTVADPTAHALGLRSLARRVPEENALHSSMNGHPAPRHRIVHCNDSCSPAVLSDTRAMLEHDERSLASRRADRGLRRRASGAARAPAHAWCRRRPGQRART